VKIIKSVLTQIINRNAHTVTIVVRKEEIFVSSTASIKCDVKAAPGWLVSIAKIRFVIKRRIKLNRVFFSYLSLLVLRVLSVFLSFSSSTSTFIWFNQ